MDVYVQTCNGRDTGNTSAVARDNTMSRGDAARHGRELLPLRLRDGKWSDKSHDSLHGIFYFTNISLRVAVNPPDRNV